MSEVSEESLSSLEDPFHTPLPPPARPHDQQQQDDEDSISEISSSSLPSASAATSADSGSSSSLRDQRERVIVRVREREEKREPEEKQRQQWKSRRQEGEGVADLDEVISPTRLRAQQNIKKSIASSSTPSRPTASLSPMTLRSLVFGFLYLLLGTLFYVYHEDWPLLTSLYFISLSGHSLRPSCLVSQ